MPTDTAQAGLAQRYALALESLAEEAHAVDAVASDLKALKALMTESRDLDFLIHSPALSREEQTRGIEAVLTQAGAHDLTRKFAGVLAANRRLFALRRIIDAFLARLAERRGEVIAEVRSAQPLDAAQSEMLTQALRQAFGGKVSLDLHVDPALLGGLVVQIGSTLVDASLASQMNRLELAMKGTA